MSAIVKGWAGVTLVREEPAWDADTGQFVIDETYEGPEDAIKGMQIQLQNAGYSYRITNQGPLYIAAVRIPIAGAVVDRFEISTESVEKSIFEHPDVAARSRTYDAAVAVGDDKYRRFIENEVEERTLTGPYEEVDDWVIDHLRSGVTGWQLDFVTIKRFRSVASSGINPPASVYNLDTGFLIYSTAQLALPSWIGFVAPAYDDDLFGNAWNNTQFIWGWKRRSQRLELTGSSMEQTTELTYAPWSRKLYREAVSDLSW